MSKLRIVRERRESSEGFDQDLRGFGHDPLFNGPITTPILSLGSKTDLQDKLRPLWDDLKKEMDCEIEYSNRGRLAEITVSDKHLTPKKKLVRLFSISCLVGELLSRSDLSMQLWQRHDLGRRLIEAAHSSSLEIGNWEPSTNPPNDCFLLVQPPLVAHLAQAGFLNSGRHDEARAFSTTELMEISKSQRQAAQNHERQKAG